MRFGIWEWLRGVLKDISPEREISITVPFKWTGYQKPPMGKWHFFTDEEVQGLDTELCAMLDRARGIAGIPFTITCGLRTPADNAALPNAVSDSAHLTGHAVDLRCLDSQTRYSMLKGLLAAGFTRIGIYVKDGHIHADNDATKPQEVIWLTE